MNARTFDIAPLNRAFIGFDRIFDLMDRQFTNSIQNQGYPPYNVVRVDDNNYTIELAVAGFSMGELNIMQDNRDLLIEGNPILKEFESEEHVEWKHEGQPKHFLYKGIANRSFKRTFTLADHVEVKNAKLELGILSIQLERKVPEELQPKKISITQIV